MPVTYTCAHCRANLRTVNPIKPGRMVTCPKCKQSFVPVPSDDEREKDLAAAPAVFKLADDPPAPPRSATIPDTSAVKKPFVDDEEEDPESIRKGYGVLMETEEERAKTEANKPRFGDVQEKFKRSARGPAQAMLVQPTNLLTIEGFVTAVAGLGLFIYGMWPLVFSEAPAGDEETEEAIMLMLGGVMVFIWGAVICVGASMMQNLQSYTMAIVGAVMGILPFFAGVYALAVLRNPKVIAGFEEVEVDESEEEDDEEEGDDDDEDDD